MLASSLELDNKIDYTFDERWEIYMDTVAGGEKYLQYHSSWATPASDAGILTFETTFYLVEVYFFACKFFFRDLSESSGRKCGQEKLE